jgi:transcriptional regulator with XRE-family HTH domain
VTAPRLQFRYRLKHLREAAGLTQAQLEKKARLPKGTLTHFEAKVRLPSLPVFFRLVKALGVSADEFADCQDLTGELIADKPVLKRGPVPKK